MPKKVPKEDEAKRDGVINSQNYNFNQFQHRQFRCSQNEKKKTKKKKPKYHQIRHKFGV